MRTTWSFHTAPQIHFGRGVVGQLGDLIQLQGCTRALLVTDANLVKAGIVDEVINSLARTNIETLVSAEGEAEPSLATATTILAQANDFKPDVIVGIGGGSNMDLAKIVAMVQTHGGEPRDYFGFDNVPGPIMPVICIPTTAGTGSEVSHSAVLTDTQNKVKVSTLSQRLRPTVALIDPELTISCPKQVTAESGIDALTHAIEAYTAKDYFDLGDVPSQARAYAGRFPLSDCLAEKAIQLVGEHLRTAVFHPEDLAAREGMALAATLAGMAFSNAGVALVHALEYPLGGALHCSHGGGNGMLLPYVMQFNLPEREETFAKIASFLGCDTTNMGVATAAEAAIRAVILLRQEIGIPERIRDFGGTSDQLPGFASKSFAIDRLIWLNPRKPTEADLLAILESAL